MSAINERVSPKRLAEIIARAEVCDDSVLTDYRDIESIARELQQYRAAAEPMYQAKFSLGWRDVTKEQYDDNAAHGAPVRIVYAAPQVTSVEREAVRADHVQWSQATFGNVGPIGPLKHLSKEALEAAAAPDDLSEWADMQFLLWDAQRRAGISDEQITQAMVEKLAVNKQREWPEPKDGEPRLHIAAPAVQAEQLSGNTEQVSQPYTLTFDQWLSQQAGEIDVDCGCVTTEAFFHWLRAAYEAGNSPAIPDGWLAEAERLAEMYGTSFVVFRHGEEAQCADPTKVIISFTDEGLGHHSAAPKQEAREVKK